MQACGNKATLLSREMIVFGVIYSVHMERKELSKVTCVSPKQVEHLEFYFTEEITKFVARLRIARKRLLVYASHGSGRREEKFNHALSKIH
jgi:hypothetical protein